MQENGNMKAAISPNDVVEVSAANLFLFHFGILKSVIKTG